ncbi:DUF2971 domain-containing protein [Wenyingzhuangia sp. 2_MG-2023]|uniref:DUF2971 domain-containing protein n=1 Tax=Wenyingzhuangia sp. 2_MG-2023 TaxID=3062639 RepID=UPI0026E2BD69|nr:DUF2971 domain-containing protein [Wenyingzhuangia sp. 2_MG-2023]MDO6738009.1 DUF2971 domain-containing protein [Wenyingzhuangia sp. 2_MG-2023]
MGENIPVVVYKYLDFETGIEKVLKEGTIKFSTPSSFNDPFDCYEVLIEPISKISREQVDFSMFFPINYEEGDKFLRDTSIEYFKKYKEEIRITSFSECYKNILMWSHYGEKHTGLSIGFSTELNKRDFNRVDYKKEIIPKPFDADGDEKNNLEAINYWLYTKSKDWGYEKEIRFINSDKTEFLTFNPKIIKEVYFGLKVSSEKIKNKIKELQLYGYEHVKFYQMKEVPNEFRIEKELINTEDIF